MQPSLKYPNVTSGNHFIFLFNSKLRSSLAKVTLTMNLAILYVFNCCVTITMCTSKEHIYFCFYLLSFTYTYSFWTQKIWIWRAIISVISLHTYYQLQFTTLLFLCKNTMSNKNTKTYRDGSCRNWRYGRWTIRLITIAHFDRHIVCEI